MAISTRFYVNVWPIKTPNKNDAGAGVPFTTLGVESSGAPS